MARCVSKNLALVILVLASVASASGQTIRRCGYDRWPVKILGDKDRERVNLTAAETTVAQLAGIKIHEVPYPRDRRIEPEELKVYKLRAKLMEVRPEQDSDVHLIIADLNNSTIRMIAEIPAPECAAGTGHEEEYRKARALLSEISVGSVIELVGVGFFDFLHDAKGGAPNGIELHPVLKIVQVRP